MFASAIVVFREVLEAALVLGIVLAASRGIVNSRAWITAGVVAGVLGAICVAAAAEPIAAAFQGVGQELFNATVLSLAVVMLAWHAIWMRKHGAVIARELRDVGDALAAGDRHVRVLGLIVGLAVLREGSEVVLFMYGLAAGGLEHGPLLAGAVLGLVAGMLAGALMYFGLLKIPARHLFSVTGALLVVLAAGMASQAARYLVQAGWLPGIVEPIWDLSAVLPTQGVIGQLLHALAGYDARPSAMQVLVFAGTLAVIVAASRAVNRPRGRLAVATTLMLCVTVSGLHARPARADHVVYSPIVEQGEIAVELRGHYDFDDRDDVDGGQKYKAEVEWAPTARWLTEALVEFERAPNENPKTTEVAWENVFQLTEQGRYWADFGLLAEYAHSLEDDGEDAIELGLLAEKQSGRHLGRVNLTFERELTGSAETEVGYAWQYRFRRGEQFEPGLEMHGELGDTDHLGAFDEHEQQLGPACFGMLRTSAGHLKYEAALLFGLTHESPDHTLRVMFEYEF